LQPEKLFESLRKQVDPKKVDERAKAFAEREQAQNAKAQQRLAQLVCGAFFWDACGADKI